MIAILSTLLPATLMCIGLLPIFFLVVFWRKKHLVRRSPLTKNLLRPAGYSLQQEIESKDIDAFSYLIYSMILPLLLFIIYLTSDSETTTDRNGLIIVLVLVPLGAEIIICTKLWRLLTDVRNKRQGMEAERFTAAELNLLMLDGCRVFHDIPSGDFNIDHVVVAPTGVYAINTKAIGKLADSSDAKVTFDPHANAMKFPDRTISIPVSQLEAENRWLTKALSGAVGEPVSVQSMLALPGWFVEAPNNGAGVTVFNPSNNAWRFVKGPEKIGPQLQQRIAHQLENLCRDVEPSHKKKSTW